MYFTVGRMVYKIDGVNPYHQHFRASLEVFLEVILFKRWMRLRYSCAASLDKPLLTGRDGLKSGKFDTGVGS